MQSKERGLGRMGQVLIVAPVVIFAMGAMIALNCDVGMMFWEASRLQNAADASSLAAVHVLLDERAAGSGEQLARDAAAAEALAICRANCEKAALSVEFGTVDSNGYFVAADSTVQASAVRSRPYRNPDAPGGSLGLAFAGLVGMHTCDAYRAAVADAASNLDGTTGGLSPFAVHRSTVEDAIQNDTDPLTFYPGDGEEYDSNCDMTVAPGCFGLLNLDGGDLSNTEVVDWIENGYNEPFDLADDGTTWIDGTSGFRASLQQPLQNQIGQEMVVAVYDELVGSGSTADFHVTSFMRITLTAVHMTGQNAYVNCHIEEVGPLDDVMGGGAYGSPNLRKVQLVQ